MKKLLLILILASLIVSSVSALDRAYQGNENARNSFFVTNLTKVCFVNDSNCINASTVFGGGSGFINVTNNITINVTNNITNNVTTNVSVDGVTLKLNGSQVLGNYTNGSQGITVVKNLINVTLSYWTNLFYQKEEINNLSSNLQSNITVEKDRITQINATQIADNTTQGGLISALFFANTTLRADNGTQATLINSKVNTFSVQSQSGYYLYNITCNATSCSFLESQDVSGNGSGGFSNNSDVTIRDLNVSRLAVVNGSAVCTAGNGLCSGSSYSAGLGLNLSGSVFNVNSSYFMGLFYLQNDTDWRVGLLQTNITNAISRADGDNSTQASLINSLFSANNTHSLDNATQSALINSLFAANNTLVADNSTQASLINQRLANGSTANLSTLRVENNVSLGNSLNFTSIGSCIYGVGGSLCFNGTGVVIS